MHNLSFRTTWQGLKDYFRAAGSGAALVIPARRSSVCGACTALRLLRRAQLLFGPLFTAAKSSQTYAEYRNVP